jgi:hypothetical protein
MQMILFWLLEIFGEGRQGIPCIGNSRQKNGLRIKEEETKYMKMSLIHVKNKSPGHNK